MNIIKKVNFNMHLKLILRPLIEWMDENSIDEIQSLSKKVNENFKWILFSFNLLLSVFC